MLAEDDPALEQWTADRMLHFQPHRPSDTRSTRRIASRLRAIKATKLRANGFSLQDIADELGFNSPQAAHAAIKSCLRRSEFEASRDLWVYEMAKLDQCTKPLMPRVMRGDLKAIDRLGEIADRRMRLFERFGDKVENSI